jgi:hypothetical protein
VDNIYVMVYDTRAVVGKEYGDDFVHADGFARAVMFVRSDDFMNWRVAYHGFCVTAGLNVGTTLTRQTWGP